MYFEGVLLSAGLIIAIGAQNAYVLKQGIQNNHVFAVATVCFLCDFILMSLGILGVGTFVAKNQLLQLLLAGGGMLYILWFALQSFLSIRHPQRLELKNTESAGTINMVIVGALAITLLNPHVYLDTVVIIGGIAGTLETEHKPIFLMGVLTSSAIWFYGLAYGARKLAPLFRKPITWQVLNFLIGSMMLFIAYQLGLFILQALMANH
ncbi:MAG TPA: LysE/ArgO family amino acid transporter [Candidatus Ignatzschineria merdigallinarum]|uniref:LysE/ArgO family amino acid transporter n=1 Tax=Candidatus Ignatzschineria merdigallinarum TaxID=2838621 RepID=A0A9D1Q6B2_9GAMM|nr:LysE/ArgO family amino acid transporter [Candidatus Ignatzschineria merdigallinarum]